MPEPLLEREFVGRFDMPAFGILIHREGALADADAATVTATMQSEPTEGVSEVVFVRQATRVALGTYQVTLDTAETDVAGDYKITWTYAIDGAPQEEQTFLTVGANTPTYDALSDSMKGIVEMTWMRFADGFDSVSGGPHLQTYLQSHFGRERLAQLLRIAVGYLNTAAQPFQTYTIDNPDRDFPVATWGPLLEFVLYLETVRHLRRSYTEQPNAELANVARMDRRDYMTRWGDILREEEPRLKEQMSHFKIANMGLGSPSVLVAGGAYPNFSAGSRVSPARPRFMARFY